MLKKLISGVVMVAGVIAMAMPAHALPVVRHADFGSNGSVRVAYVNHRWMGRANILGLSNGTYEVYMNSWLDENHDGTPDGGVSREICKLKVTTWKHAARCKGGFKDLLDEVRGPGVLGDINTVDIERLENDTGVTVLSADLK
ncbi:MAG TPA: hypothetical protein VL856_11260 [Acidimicrobiia bacterium]|jgi:hypothetical protein|nr:hypothetical protein [Acidimicrobiia bacterium]